VARRILGRDASPEAVAALNKELGTDRNVIVQYWDWVSSFVTGDLGTSYNLRVPVSDLIFDALANSFKLAVVAFLIVVPLGILGGVFAALREGRFVDRFISIAGLSAVAVPEFVSSIILILLFGLWLELLPITAAWPPGAGLLTQLKYLILPSLPLVLVLFGYIARMARAGTIEALDADYTRTAVLKGLPQRTVIRRHVLRNALLPTIAVVATQTGYLIGGLVVIEVIFNYQGVGRLLFDAARSKDFPMLQSAVLVVGIVYLLATLVADVAYSLLNPRIRYARS
jgi:peptide/nickel transport system permease protein